MIRAVRLGCASFLASIVVLLPVTPLRAEPVPPVHTEPVTPKRGEAGAADPPFDDARFDLGAHALYTVGDLDGRLLDDFPVYEALDLRLHGRGRFTGGALSGAFVYKDSFRFGVSFSAFAVEGVTLGHVPLSSDLTLSLHQPYGFTVEGTPGWELHFGRFVPYAEARLGIASMSYSVDVRSARLGLVQTMDRPALSAVVAPRIGLQLQLFQWVALDVSASLSPVGVELLRLQAGLVFKMYPGK